MNKEKLYGGIKNTLYRRFDKLKVVERNSGAELYLRYNQDKHAEIVIKKRSCNVYYYYGFKSKLNKLLPIEDGDFEILLIRWIEEKFKMKVHDTIPRLLSHEDRILKIPIK